MDLAQVGIILAIELLLASPNQTKVVEQWFGLTLFFNLAKYMLTFSTQLIDRSSLPLAYACLVMSVGQIVQMDSIEPNPFTNRVNSTKSSLQIKKG